MLLPVPGTPCRLKRRRAKTAVKGGTWGRRGEIGRPCEVLRGHRIKKISGSRGVGGGTLRERCPVYHQPTGLEISFYGGTSLLDEGYPQAVGPGVFPEIVLNFFVRLTLSCDERDDS
jgi:hypothetical protein